MIEKKYGNEKPLNSKQVSLLRIAATLAVLMLHAGGVMSPSLSGSPFWSEFNSILRVLCFWAVPVFVIVSGYCLLGRGMPVLEFYRRRAARIFLPLIAWSAFYLMFRALSKTGFSGRELGRALWEGSVYYHLWFLYMILGLYALAPWYEKLRRKLSLSGEIAAVLTLSAAGCFLAQAVPRWWTTPFGTEFMAGFPVHALELFGLFAAGPLLGRLAAVRPVRWFALAFILADTAVKIFLWRTGRIKLLDWLCFYYNFESFLIGGAVFLFWIGMPDWKLPATVRTRQWIELAARVTFGVYLVHVLFIYIASRIPGFFRPDALHYFGVMLFVVVGSFAVCMPVKRIPFLRRLV